MKNEKDEIQFQLTEELWDGMQVLEGQPIASLVIWDSSLVDDNLDSPVADEERIYVDCELYLANQTLLELYGAAILYKEADEALAGLQSITATLEQLADTGAVLQEVAADQENSLVLTIANQSGESVLVAVTAWLETTWDALPEEAYT